MHQGPSSFSTAVITSSLWDAIKDIPGVSDLHRHPVQSPGERVRMERRGPARLEQGDHGPLLELQIIVEGVSIAAVGEAVAQAGADYLARTAGTPITHVDAVVAGVGVAGGP